MSESPTNREAISHSYAPIPATTIGPLRVVWGSRTYIMAVANLTPDSFSGDGLISPSASMNDLLDRVEQLARDAVRDGADLLDLGAESTRPGHTEISAAEEIARLIPAIERLRRVLPTLALSADTQKVEVAAAALDAGAHMLNDIWGTRSGDEMLQLAAERGVPIVVMHNRKEVTVGEQATNFAEEFLDEMAAVAARGRALGMVMRLPERDNYSYHRDKMYANLSVSMGGRVAEEIIFGYDKVSSGASSDIQYATNLARDMVTRWGMSDVLGPLQYAEADEEVFLGYSRSRGSQMSNETAVMIDQEIKRIVEGGYNQAKKLLTKHKKQLHALAEALLEYETMSGDEIKALLADGTKPDRSGIDRNTPRPLGKGGTSIPKTRRTNVGGPAAEGA